MIRVMRVIVIGVFFAGCTSAVVPRIEHPRRDEAPAIRIGQVRLIRGGEVAAELDAQGAILAPSCHATIAGDGTVRDREGAIVLRVHSGGSITGQDGTALYAIEGAALRVPGLGAATLEGDQVTFEGSGDLALRVERDGADERAVLLLLAAISTCEQWMAQ